MSDGHVNKRIDDLERTAKRIERKLNYLEAIISSPRQEHETGEDPQQATSEKDDSAQRQPALVPKVPPTPSHSNQSQKPWYKTFRGWKTLFETIALPFAIGYAVVTFLQWRDLRHNFEGDERAWVKPEFAWNSSRIFPEGGDFVPGQMFDGNVTLRLNNTGKSPIVRSKSYVWIEILDHNSAPTFSMPANHIASLGIFIFPDSHDDIEVHRVSPDGKYFDPSPEELELIGDGNDYVVIYGATIYYDRFGSHWIRYCEWWHNTDPSVVARGLRYNSGPCWEFSADGDGENPFASATQIQHN